MICIYMAYLNTYVYICLLLNGKSALFKRIVPKIVEIKHIYIYGLIVVTGSSSCRTLRLSVGLKYSNSTLHSQVKHITYC